MRGIPCAKICYHANLALVGGVFGMENGIKLFLARRTEVPIPRTTIPDSPSRSLDCR